MEKSCSYRAGFFLLCGNPGMFSQTDAAAGVNPIAVASAFMPMTSPQAIFTGAENTDQTHLR